MRLLVVNGFLRDARIADVPNGVGVELFVNEPGRAGGRAGAE